MELLHQLVAYNGWANEKVFASCAGLDAASLEKPAPGSFGTVLQTLRHLVGTEDVCLLILRGQEVLAALGSLETSFVQPFAWLLQRQAELRREYDTQALAESEATLGRLIQHPCLERPMSACEWYLHCMTHSAHHRAQVFSILGARGIEVPDLDYVLMLTQEAG